MRLNKIVFIVTIIVTIGMRIGVAYYPKDTRDYDLCLTIYGSALLASIVALYSYVSEYRSSRKEFIYYATRLNGLIYRIGPLKLFGSEMIPTDMISKCVCEEWKKRYNEENTNKVSLKYIIDEEACNTFRSFLRDLTKYKDEQYVSVLYDLYIDEYLKLIDRTIDHYIEFSEIDITSFMIASESLDFTFHKKKKRESARRVVNPITDFRGDCLEAAYFFKKYKQGCLALDGCIKVLLELDEKLHHYEGGVIHFNFTKSIYDGIRGIACDIGIKIASNPIESFENDNRYLEYYLKMEPTKEEGDQP